MSITANHTIALCCDNCERKAKRVTDLEAVEGGRLLCYNCGIEDSIQQGQGWGNIKQSWYNRRKKLPPMRPRFMDRGGKARSSGTGGSGKRVTPVFRSQ